MESYALLISSANSVNRTGTSTAEYTYFIDWSRVIPKKYQHHNFEYSFVFRTDTTTTILTESILVSATVGFVSMYTQSGTQSSLLGAIVPGQYVTTAGDRFYYQSNHSDDASSMCAYPTSTYLTVTVTNFAGVAVAPPAYTLQLIFNPIEM